MIRNLLPPSTPTLSPVQDANKPYTNANTLARIAPNVLLPHKQKSLENLCDWLKPIKCLPNIPIIIPALQLDYRMPLLKNAYLMEAEAGFNEFLTKLTFEDFVCLWMSVLLEKNIVFVSESRSLLSSAIACINACIRPLKWSFPLVYMLPKDCLLLLESPVPLQLGVNSSVERFLGQIVPVHCPQMLSQSQTLFVLLDAGLLVPTKSLLASINLPYFEDCLLLVQTIYKKSFVSRQSRHVKLSKKKNGAMRKYSMTLTNASSLKSTLSKLKKKGVNMNQSQIRRKKEMPAVEIFEVLKGILDKYVFSRLPVLNTPSESGFKTLISQILF